MRHFQRKGNRIRASDKTLVFRTATNFLLLVFLVVLLLLNIGTLLHTDWKSVSLLHEGSFHLTVTPYMIGSVMVAGAVSVAAAFLYRYFLPNKVKQLSHRQKLARMILENGWYESEKTPDSGFFKDLPDSRSREKITHFPKVYYRLEHGLIHIQAEITLGKYQEQLLHLEKKLETGLYCELVSKELKDSFVEYLLLYDTIANRITIDEVQSGYVASTEQATKVSGVQRDVVENRHARQHGQSDRQENRRPSIAQRRMEMEKAKQAGSAAKAAPVHERPATQPVLEKPTSPATVSKVQHSEPMKKERPAVSRENISKYPTPKEPVTKTQEIRTHVKNEPVSPALGARNPASPERKNPSLSGNKEIRQTATKRSVQKMQSVTP